MVPLLSILGQKKNYGRHIKNFSRIPGLIYSFENQNLITFEDNFCDNHLVHTMILK